MTPLQALAELVALKDLHDQYIELNEPEDAERLAEYLRRKPLAWAAARAVLAQGEGWVMVPKEPTEVMRLAGNASYWASQLANRGEYRYEDDDAGVVYRAMIAAAPKVPT